MRYIVDGYNLLYVSPDHQPARSGRSLEECRGALIRKLGVFAVAEGTHVTVVFDGDGPGGGTRGAEVETLFTRSRGGADERIVRLVEEAANRKTLTVVSSDREVGLQVRRLGATVVRSGAFMKRVEALLSSAPASQAEPPEKLRPPSEAETEFWLGVFDADEDE